MFVTCIIYMDRMFTVFTDCGGLPDPANGHVAATNTTFGQVVTYSCNAGYNLVGSRNRVCQSDTSWSGTPPICQPKGNTSGMQQEV